MTVIDVAYAPTDVEILPGAPLLRVKKRGYYKDTETGEKYTSVTTILEHTVAKPALPPWAANTVAKTAMDNLPYLVRSSRDLAEQLDAYNWLRAAADRVKDERKEVGGAVHRAVESRILGDPMSQDDAVNPDLLPYLGHLEAFMHDWEIEFTASEMIVANGEHFYGGTLDCLFTSPKLARKLRVDPALQISLDVKTGGQLDVKGVYPEACLQMAGYGHATFAQMRDGTRIAMPPVAPRGIVLHLRPEGYRPVPADVGDGVFAQFLALHRLYADWNKGLSKHVLGDALTLDDPTVPEGD